MLGNAAITKVLGGGFVTLAAAGSGCYLYMQQELMKDVMFDPLAGYLIVKSTAITENHSDDVLQKNFNNNFKCKFSNHIDKYCEILRLSDVNKNLTEALNDVKQEFVKKETIKEANNYYKLVASQEIMDAITKWDDPTELIDIVKKDDNSNSNHIFAKFQPIYKVKKGRIIKRKNSLVMTKVESDGTNITQPNDVSVQDYQCGFTNSSTDDKFSCELSEIVFDNKTKTYIVNETKDSALIKENLKIANKNFQIKLTQEYLDRIFNNGNNKKIYVFPKNLTNSNQDKILAILTPQFKILDQKITGQDKFFLSLVASSPIDVTGNNFSNSTCKINSSQTPISCSIFSFANKQSTTTVNDVKKINVGNTLTLISASNQIEANNYFAIKLDNSNKYKLSEETTITLTNSDSPSKNYSFTVKGNMFLDATLASQNYTINGAYIF